MVEIGEASSGGGQGVTSRSARAIAWALLAISLACIPVGIAIVALTGIPVGQAVLLAPVACATFATVGALVSAGAPRSAVGWLLLGIGLVMGASILTSALNRWDVARPGTFTGASFVALADGQLWLLPLGFLIPRLLLLFPDGRLPSQRWRLVSWSQFAVLGGLLVSAFMPGPIRDYEQYVNPIGIGAFDFLHRLPAVLTPVVGALFVFATLGAVLAVIVRFRRSRGIERLQMKWVAWAVGVTAMLWVANPLVQRLFHTSVLEPLSLIGLVLSPVAVGVAVLRYRLYEIDRIISRTLVYGALTVVLGAAYAGLVLGGQAVFSSFAGGSNLAIAVSTLVVAALFLPLRSRVQRFVDRRFYRRRYDAQRTLERFGARLREQVELEALRGDLVGVVGETMQPAHVGLWLRTEAAR